MQVIDLGKLRFQMRGEWLSDAEYESNDAVRYGGNLYVYTYPLKQAGNLPTNPARFTLMMAGTTHRGIYDAEAAYRIGESVTFGSGIYRASEDVPAGTIPDAAPALWLKVSDSPSYRGAWAAGEDYRKGDLVTYGGSTESCVVSHTAVAFAQDKLSAKWATFLSGIRYLGTYAPGATYLPDDIVSDGLHLRAAKGLIQAAPALLVDADWVIVVRGADYLPSQLGHAGKALLTDGVEPAWGDLTLFNNAAMLAQIHAVVLSK